VVLHPTDWTNILLLKDTQGRYLFSDPHGQTSPQVWGKPVVATSR
jgi:HK97 family phage major capsid protein